MYYRIEISPKPGFPDARGNRVLEQARSFLNLDIETIRTRDVYSFFTNCSKETIEKTAEAFTNPVIQNGVIGESTPDTEFDWMLVVGYRPGVTDTVAQSARAALQDIHGR